MEVYPLKPGPARSLTAPAQPSRGAWRPRRGQRLAATAATQGTESHGCEPASVACWEHSPVDASCNDNAGTRNEGCAVGGGAGGGRREVWPSIAGSGALAAMRPRTKRRASMRSSADAVAASGFVAVMSASLLWMIGSQ